MRQAVLLVGADSGFFATIAQRLSSLELDSCHSTDGHCALNLITRQRWDAAVTEACLTGTTIRELCEALRSKEHCVPVLVCTNASLAIEAVLVYESGADDYFEKNLEAVVIDAKIRSAIRRRTRCEQFSELQTERHDSGVFVASKNIIDATELTRFEERLLQLLAAAQGQIVPAAEIIDAVWRRTRVEPGALYEQFSKLRAKLFAKGWTIKNVRAKGYRLERLSNNNASLSDGTGR